MSHSAAILVIGDEILSGRTQDTNTHYIAGRLAALGIDLKECRVVPDVETEIVAALNALRARYDFVFTTGGIGPTHDDITADAVAKAFGVGIGFHAETFALMEANYGRNEFNPMRQRMARLPDGAAPIPNSASVAPGFRIGTVFVMAGVPRVMRAMMETIEPGLPLGAPVIAITVAARIGEGLVAAGLAEIQKQHADVSIGSYPFYTDDGFGVELVARSRDAGAVEKAAREIEKLLTSLGATSSRL